ncbi:hypothetical protein B5X24_HaOG215343 [Helicoverpa armigera]|nr:hypothetical protein B5X24_HaOG215343 [Helicoverpa armigera]
MENSDPLINNAFMFIYARQDKPCAEKIENLETVLNNGADINYRDANDKSNTILHIAAQRDEKDVVDYLLKKGALILYNTDNIPKTPVHIAKEKDTLISKQIYNILIEYDKHSSEDKNSKKLQIQLKKSCSLTQQNSCATPAEITYPKRAGTSGVSGQFYETKLLSLVLHRALHDKVIEECYLAANIRDIGDLDDVCFRFKMQEDGKTKHVLCFTQAKHREDVDKAKLTVTSVRSTSGQFCLVKYFDSFLKIRQKFLTKSKTYDPMFEGEFDHIDCYFILYTPLKESFDRKRKGNERICKKMHDFIFTKEIGDEDEIPLQTTVESTQQSCFNNDVFQFEYEDSDVMFLTYFMQQERMKVLGRVFLTFILSDKTKEVMTNDLIQIYHPALARQVIKLTIKDSDNFVGTFREDFFDSDDNLLIILKQTLFKEIVFKQTKKTKLTKDEIKEKIMEIVKNPTSQAISALIGEVIYLDDKNNKLCLDIDKINQKKYKSEEIREINHTLQKIQTTQAIVNDAVNITGKEKLTKLKFELPYTFGNSDFPSNLKDGKIPKERLEFLANKFYELIKEKKKSLENEGIKTHNKPTSDPIVINISNHNVGPKKILELSHLNTKGIGGTVGNLLEFDALSQTFSFNKNEKSLGNNSKYMLNEIKKLTQEDLANYKIKVKMTNFPRTSFEPMKIDEVLAKDFLNKLWFYTNQAKEETVEKILKKEIDYHHNINKSENQFLFRVHSDAIFLRFHDEIQKWWKSQTQARYLTKTDKIFDEAKRDIIDSPVLTVLNIMFIRTLKILDIEFDDNVVNSMDIKNMIDNKKVINIVSEAIILSATKLMQMNKFETKYTFLNLEYVHILPDIDYCKLIEELRDIKNVTLVIICERPLNDQVQETLEKMIDICNGNIIVITEKPLQEEKFKNLDYLKYNDGNIDLDSLHPTSQNKVLTEFNVCYQGEEVPLNTLIDDTCKSLVRANILWKILNKNKIEIGHSLETQKYNEIKDYYINRILTKDDDEFEVNTFHDIEDKIVLITSLPCNGKSILLTHLSLETKKQDPQPWIVRINLSVHGNEFEGWPDNGINITNVMRFLCKAALKSTDSLNKIDFIELTDERVAINRDHLAIQDIPFELECFIHCYNNGQVIFVFDGYDEIYLSHRREGIQLFKALKHANKQMWVASNSYSIHLLKKILGTPYKLDRLSTTQKDSFLNRFWKTNLQLEKLNHQQINNISSFFNFIAKTFNKQSDAFPEERPMVHLLSIPLHIIYMSAAEYFKNEINNISPRYLREKLKKKWRLNSYTPLDRFFRNPDEMESSGLTGTPLHLYIAANYFQVNIKDKFELSIKKEEITSKSQLYLNTIATYDTFMKRNLKHICEITQINDENLEQEQNKVREDFLESHKKLALYAICKESDISQLLTEAEVQEVKTIIRKIETGEMKSHLIDCIVDGVPRFYNLLFAEYFISEFVGDMLKKMVRGEMQHVSFESMWNFLVNGIILLCPPGVRNAFEYKLKHDPDLADLASNEESDKILFKLVVKPEQKAELAGNTETSLNIAINEGLVNVTNLLLKGARQYVTKDNADGVVSIIKTSAFVAGAANPSWKELTDNVMHCIHNVDSDNLIETINSEKLEDISRTVTDLCTSTELGKKIHDKIKKDVCEPIREAAEAVVESSSNNENINALMELLPHHLPSIVNSLFGKK